MRLVKHVDLANADLDGAARESLNGSSCGVTTSRATCVRASSSSSSTCPLVRSLARRYAYRGEPLDDLVQIGAIGLIKAIDRFDLDLGVELTELRGADDPRRDPRHFRDRTWAVRVPRGLQELHGRPSAARSSTLTVQHGRSPRSASSRRRPGWGGGGAGGDRVGSRLHVASRSPRRRADDDDHLDPLERSAPWRTSSSCRRTAPCWHPASRGLTTGSGGSSTCGFLEGLTQSQIARQIGISQMHVSLPALLVAGEDL